MSILIFIGLVLITTYVSESSAHPTQEDTRELFEHFKRRYQKVYSSGIDEEKRFGIFKDNLVRVATLQQQEKDTAKYGVTKFSDLTAEEFAARFTNARFDNVVRELKEADSMELRQAPSSFDWRDKGAVTPVEDQGLCGSCWAFSVVGNVEGQHFLSGGNLTVLSKQQLVDCDQVDDGCSGGYPPQTYGEIQRMGGLVPEDGYPYEARRGQCRLNASQIAARIKLAVVVTKDEGMQAGYLAQHGPLSSALNADPLQFYLGGIFNPRRCSPHHLNHAVLSVGYGEENNVPYWTVKNSWGADWGEDGYFRIRRGHGTCGINQLVTSAIV